MGYSGLGSVVVGLALRALAHGRVRGRSRDNRPVADSRGVSAQRGLIALARAFAALTVSTGGARQPRLFMGGSAAAPIDPAARVTSRDRPASACGHSASDD
jgi:hypothetical protein